MPYFIRYNSIKFRNSLLKIQAEERVKLETKPKKDTSVSLQVFVLYLFKIIFKFRLVIIIMTLLQIFYLFGPIF